MFPKIEPNIKLEPTIKLIGSSMVSSIIKSTLLLFELFCIATNKITNKQELNITVKNNFLPKDFMYIDIYINVKSYYKFRFFLGHFSWLSILTLLTNLVLHLLNH